MLAVSKLAHDRHHILSILSIDNRACTTAHELALIHQTFMAYWKGVGVVARPCFRARFRQLQVCQQQHRQLCLRVTTSCAVRPCLCSSSDFKNYS